MELNTPLPPKNGFLGPDLDTKAWIKARKKVNS